MENKMETKSIFDIIKNEQTPGLPEMDDVWFKIGFNKGLYVDFIEYASNLNNALALAGNQVSLNGKRFEHRIFAYKTVKAGWQLVIDPKIVKMYGEKDLRRELCLTWPGKAVFAERYYRIDVEYWTLGRDYIKKTVRNLEAQIFQHEIDHLNGVEESIVDKNISLPKKHKINRNDLCPCGSGKKYKKCCLLNIK